MEDNVKDLEAGDLFTVDNGPKQIPTFVLNGNGTITYTPPNGSRFRVKRKGQRWCEIVPEDDPDCTIDTDNSTLRPQARKSIKVVMHAKRAKPYIPPDPFEEEALEEEARDRNISDLLEAAGSLARCSWVSEHEPLAVANKPLHKALERLRTALEHFDPDSPELLRKDADDIDAANLALPILRECDGALSELLKHPSPLVARIRDTVDAIEARRFSGESQERAQASQERAGSTQERAEACPLCDGRGTLDGLVGTRPCLCDGSGLMRDAFRILHTRYAAIPHPLGNLQCFDEEDESHADRE